MCVFTDPCPQPPYDLWRASSLPFAFLLKEFVCAELPALESAAKGGQLVACNEACREAQATREAQEKALAAQKAEKKEAKKKLKESKATSATARALPDAGKQGGLLGNPAIF